MAKFTFHRDEQEEEEEGEEGASTSCRPILKRQRRSLNYEEEEDEDEADDDEDDSKPKKDGGGLSVTLMDPDVLDCAICMEPLSSPVFQCENGHIACSPCCTKLRNKCPSCSWPIGYNRCLAIEKVIESIRVSCGYKSYGCGETLGYTKKHAHEETCIYAPFACPISDCDFCGSSKQLSIHFSRKHSSSARRFQYNAPFSVSFGKLEPYLILQGEGDGILFVLSNQIELIGSAIRLACLGSTSSNGGFLYELISRKGCDCLTLQSRTKCVKERNETSLSASFLLVPYEYYGSSEKLKLEIKILKRVDASS